MAETGLLLLTIIFVCVVFGAGFMFGIDWEKSDREQRKLDKELKRLKGADRRQSNG